MGSTPKAIDSDDLAKVVGGNYTDRRGTEGTDTITGTDGMDKVFAAGGNDVISTGGGADEVHAGTGDDFVNAGTGNDKVFGGEGNDTIQGRGGSDELFGEGGNDAMDGGYRDGAADKAFGGEGNDTYIWSPGDGNDEFHGGNGQDTLFLHNVNLETFQNAVQLYNPNLQMQLASDGTISFTDQSGAQVPFSGQVTIGGETMKFFEVERIRISF